ncbi:MauE/DoxX family redox-associated membrane protein [Alteromonas sp. CYL-A6]|uniref:MauE/DoxX family redox-associated membrane protein n=1 Tax=Alteromonas nitratireducens TaxID=3390813 RepID=UPI0034AC71C6
MTKRATLYRMKTDEHICPFGLKAKDLLERECFEVEDNLLTSRQQTDEFKQQHQVDTTPQVFIDGERIGGYEALRDYLNKPKEGQQGKTYTPVIAVMIIAVLLSVCLSLAGKQAWQAYPLALNAIAFFMVLLALQKLQDVTAFTNRFITYDLLAMKHIRYAYLYPFAEAWAGLGMLAMLPVWAVAPVSVFIGTIGAISVIKAVYIDKRELTCACVGGDSNVPLGALTLTENVLMAGAGIAMLIS